MIRKDRKEHQNKDGTMNKKIKGKNKKRKNEVIRRKRGT
jgi:hypothetical protein